MQTFNHEVLLQYLYGETSAQLTIAIEEALQVDFMLQDELNTLKRSVKQLDSLKLSSPSNQSVNKILQYAKSAEEVTE